ncbi:MAG: hypothetical protein ACYDER_19380 [Ktedonobacteraceae bacterium]
MLNTHTTARPEGPITVKVDPVLGRMRKARMLTIASIVMYFIAGILFSIGYAHDRSAIVLSFLASLFIFIGCISLISIVTMTLQVRFWKRLEQRRQTAVRGEQTLLAAEQPTSDANALSLPTTIEQRPNWTMLLAIPGILLILTIVFDYLLINFPQTFSPNRPVPSSALFIIAAVIFFIMLLISGLLVAAMYYRVRQQITVTQDGILMFGFRKIHAIRWDEARLFAIIGLYGAKKYKNPFFFELSNANEVIRWNWIRKNTRKLIFFAKPTIPQADYDRQLQALNSLIAAKTGLPLYDLRERKK